MWFKGHRSGSCAHAKLTTHLLYIQSIDQNDHWYRNKTKQVSPVYSGTSCRTLRIEPWTTKSGLHQAHTQVLEEYRIVMHLFEALSSPASSNFTCGQDSRWQQWPFFKGGCELSQQKSSWVNEFDHRILGLLEKQWERHKIFRPEQGFKPWPLQCWCSALPVELSCQLRAGHYVGQL